jgi:antitoxin YefM
VHTWRRSKIVSVGELRRHLAELLDEVVDHREHVTVTRRGRPAAVLVPVDAYAAFEETSDIVSDEDMLTAIPQGLDDLVAGNVVPLDEVRTSQTRAGRHSWTKVTCQRSRVGSYGRQASNAVSAATRRVGVECFVSCRLE